MSASTEKKNRVASREAGTDKKTLAMKEEAAKKAKTKRKWTIIGVATVVVIAAILVLNFVCPRYSAAVVIGDEGYTAAEVNYNYANQYYNFANQYGQYASMFGLDTQYGVSGLRSQECSMTDGGTWRDYFIGDAITAMTQYKALNDYAAENGIALSDEEKAEIDEQYASLDAAAEQNGFSSTEKFIAAYYGSGVTEKIAKEQAYVLALASKAAQTYQDSLQYTPAELAEQYSEDTGSNTNGGLYDAVQKGQMVEEFDAFCFGGHKSGDTAIVYGESGSYAGYHIMYYVGEGELCSEYIAKTDLVNNAMDEWMQELTGKYTAEQTFWARYIG